MCLSLTVGIWDFWIFWGLRVCSLFFGGSEIRVGKGYTGNDHEFAQIIIITTFCYVSFDL